MIKIDVQAARADTPGCEQVVHLNNSGASLPPQPVLEASIDYLRLEAKIGGYEAADAAAEQLAEVYVAGAELLNCDRTELAFTTGASEAWWRGFLSVPLQPGDRVLIGRTEYVANALALIQAKNRGVSVEIVPDDEFGQIDVAALERMLDERVKLVCLTSISMTNGLVNPTAQVGELVKRAGAYFLVDACQAVGQMPVDVQELQCDFLSYTGRKFVRAPRGTGMLYVRSSIMDELQEPTFIDGWSANWNSATTYELHKTAQRFELIEASYGAKVGFGRALRYALDIGLEAIEVRVTGLAERLRAGLAETPKVKVLDTGLQKCGIVTFEATGWEPGDLSARLRENGINTGSPTVAGSRFDLESRSVDSLVRAGVHYYNTEAEIDRLVDQVATLV